MPFSDLLTVYASPEYGVFVRDHLLLGGGVLAGYQSDFENDITVFGLVPFRSEIPVGVPERESFSSYQLSLGFGLNTFLTPNVALELGPNLRYLSEIDNYRLGFDIGLQYFINKTEG
ncbi:MAG: hypothetical protein AAFO03_22745 [Bacteroidota bacterium]